jgi:hypothetical protein
MRPTTSWTPGSWLSFCIGRVFLAALVAGFSMTKNIFIVNLDLGHRRRQLHKNHILLAEFVQFLFSGWGAVVKIRELISDRAGELDHQQPRSMFPLHLKGLFSLALVSPIATPQNVQRLHNEESSF